MISKYSIKLNIFNSFFLYVEVSSYMQNITIWLVVRYVNPAAHRVVKRPTNIVYINKDKGIRKASWRRINITTY